MARLVELEVPQYRTEEIEHASSVFVGYFLKYSNIATILAWEEYWIGLQDVIRNQKPRKLKLRAPGIDISFSGFPPPTPTVDDGKVVFEPYEPGFSARTNKELVLPSERTKIDRTSNAIFEEIGEVYHLTTEDPYTLTFPRKLYVGKVEVFNAALL